MNQSLDFNDLAINLNEELNDSDLKPVNQQPKPSMPQNLGNMGIKQQDEQSISSPQNKSFTFDASNQSTFESRKSLFEASNRFTLLVAPLVPPSTPYDSRGTNSTQQFTAEELVPQHMVRKAKKVGKVSRHRFYLL